MLDIFEYIAEIFVEAILDKLKNLMNKLQSEEKI